MENGQKEINLSACVSSHRFREKGRNLVPAIENPTGANEDGGRDQRSVSNG